MAKNSDFLAPGFIDFGSSLFDATDPEGRFEISGDGEVIISPFSVQLSDGRRLYIGANGEIIGIK